jgi:hypothetical protein
LYALKEKMKNKSTFDILVLNARPAAGKSEVIDYLKRCDVEERKQRFRIGEFEEIDDFPMLWTWFEEDDILQKMDKQRLHSDDQGYFKWEHLWHLLIRRMCFDYEKKIARVPVYHQTHTTILEFSRGSEHGGYREAYQHLSKNVLEHMAILYLDVSFSESLRKNRARFNPDKPDSILEHGLPDAKLERMYKEVDWHELVKNDPAYIIIQGVKVPYMIFENEDDVTTARGDELGKRLEARLQMLWQRWSAR